MSHTLLIRLFKMISVFGRVVFLSAVDGRERMQEMLQKKPMLQQVGFCFSMLLLPSLHCLDSVFNISLSSLVLSQPTQAIHNIISFVYFYNYLQSE